jgi:hypothetical protein
VSRHEIHARIDLALAKRTATPQAVEARAEAYREGDRNYEHGRRAHFD